MNSTTIIGWVDTIWQDSYCTLCGAGHVADVIKNNPGLLLEEAGVYPEFCGTEVASQPVCCVCGIEPEGYIVVTD